MTQERPRFAEAGLRIAPGPEGGAEAVITVPGNQNCGEGTVL